MLPVDDLQHVELNAEFQQALAVMEDSHAHCFITGRAGTGKSTLLQYFRANTKKKVVVLAPTGVAAVNVQGQTIHSFFGFKPDITPEKARRLAMTARRRNPKSIFHGVETIILDEISMVRADLFECMDVFLRTVRSNARIPFGGVQLILIGDLYQLPPVVTTAERSVFASRYPGPHFFNARVARDLQLEFVELTQVYRQPDPEFVTMLNAVRNNSLNEEIIARFNSRHNSQFQPTDNGFITLTSMNEPAHLINAQRLSEIEAIEHRFSGDLEGEFTRDALVTDPVLTLKVNAQVMLLNNDSQGRWVNGTLGRVEEIRLNDQTIIVELEDETVVEVTRHKWEVFRYDFDTVSGSVITESMGTFTQFPLRLAWAITIHKSQGKTYDRVVVDVGRGTFASGQMYVALSRCRSLEGLVLRQPLRRHHVIVDHRITQFFENPQGCFPDEEVAEQQTFDF
ncbi:MAG: AAA family ATPase [Deltaproteobacteria bacterium CG11_big_fil_rev_8_21_14_0_20_47_16]|nr:MAG: AAA family ATPase [Deltaproteobacteria bacterium CG11_big_fil_rev_8_21_14_0_20_47_16]